MAFSLCAAEGPYSPPAQQGCAGGRLLNAQFHLRKTGKEGVLVPSFQVEKRGREPECAALLPDRRPWPAGLRPGDGAVELGGDGCRAGFWQSLGHLRAWLSHSFIPPVFSHHSLCTCHTLGAVPSGRASKMRNALVGDIHGMAGPGSSQAWRGGGLSLGMTLEG